MRICSLITLFNPDINKLEKNLVQILTYAEKIFLLVNSQDKPILNNKDDRISIIMNNKNIGLSKAFNIGLNQAKAEGFDYAILFDQDSYLDKKNFDILFQEYNDFSINKNVMCIGPALNVYGKDLPTPNWTKDYKKRFDNEHITSVLQVITSGMLLNIERALSIGGFNEDYPVDFCDYCFCWKAIYNNYYVLKSKNSKIIHEIGNSNMSIGNHTIHFHSPYRNYFMVRDTLNIVYRLKETPFKIRIRYNFFLIPRMVLFLIHLDRKRERLLMYRLGLKDFFTNRHQYGSIAKLLNAE